jgi:hypothetical protein
MNNKKVARIFPGNLAIFVSGILFYGAANLN